LDCPQIEVGVASELMLETVVNLVTQLMQVINILVFNVAGEEIVLF
jgi:hypothetical protein